MNTNQIGDIGEAIAIAEFTKAGAIVSKPLSDNARYDLIIEWNNKLYKVQVKTTQSSNENTKMIFATKTTNYTKGHWKSTAYESGEVDLFFLYCLENNWFGLWNVTNLKEIKSSLTLRFCLPKTGQKSNINLIEDYDFTHVIASLA